MTWTFSLLGTTFAVTADEPALKALKSTLAGVTATSTKEPTATASITNRTVTAPGLELQAHTKDHAVIALAGALELYAAERCPDRIAIHAGVIAVHDRALLLPGRSLAGKSTLTKALMDAGADYLSDEYAMLDADGLVHPYPRPLRLRLDGVKIIAPPPDTRPEPRTVALIAALQHDDRGWSVTPLSKGEATLRLIENAVPAQTRSKETLDATTAAARTAQAITGTRGEAGEAARHLLELLR